MTDGTSQGLFIVVSIVIFGIFVVMAYILFEDTLSPAMANMFEETFEKVAMESPMFQNTEEVGLFTFNTTTKTITGFSQEGKSKNIKDLVIPEELGGLPVLKIGKNAFNRLGLTSVSLPEGLTHVDESAFIDNKLTTLKLPESIVEVGTASFRGNTLTSVDFGTGIKTIGVMSFYGNQLTEITVPNSTLLIGWSAFRSNKLESIQLGNSLKYVGNFAFSINNTLEEITFPESIEGLGNVLFANTNIKRIYMPSHMEEFLNDNPETLGKVYSPQSVPNTTFYTDAVIYY